MSIPTDKVKLRVAVYLSLLVVAVIGEPMSEEIEFTEELPAAAPLGTSIFFGTVFLAVACGVAYSAYLQAVEPSPYLLPITLTSAVATLFAFIGVLILVGVVFWKKMQAERELFSTLASQWEKGEIICSNKGMLYLFFALFSFATVSLLPSYYLLLQDYHQGNTEQLYWLISLVLPLALLAATLKHFLRYRKYGESICELPQGPGVIGGQLCVRIRTPSRVEAVEDFNISLSCKSKDSSIANNQGSKAVTLWEQEQQLSRHGSHSAMGLEVRFTIPDNLPPADAAGAHAINSWRLQISAKASGVNYQAWFFVPVLRRTSRA